MRPLFPLLCLASLPVLAATVTPGATPAGGGVQGPMSIWSGNGRGFCEEAALR